MSIKSINESFDKLIEKENIITESQSSLEKNMLTIVDLMEHSGQTNLKAYEYALQDAIEKEYPGKSWWEVTSVNIFWDLFNSRDPRLTIQNIINDIEGNSIEEDYKDTHMMLGGDGEEIYSDEDLEKIWDDNHDSDPSMKEYKSFDIWKKDTVSNMEELDESNEFYVGWAKNNIDGFYDYMSKHPELKIYKRDNDYYLATSEDDTYAHQIENSAIETIKSDSRFKNLFIESKCMSEEKEVSNFDGTLGNVLEKHSDELNKLTSKEDIFNFLDKIEPEVDQKNYLKRTIQNLGKKRDFISALSYLYDIIQKGHNNGVITEARDPFKNWRDVGLEIASEMDREGLYNMLLATFKWMSNNDVGEMLHQNGYLEYDFESIEEALKECLNKLTEDQISDEDKHDSDIIRSMIDKMQVRSNAKFTDEEKAVMDKYGISRDNWNRKLMVANRDLNPNMDGDRRYHWNGKGSYYKDGDTSKINYADRARKLGPRKETQIAGDGSHIFYQNRDFNRHGMSKTPLIDRERDFANADMQKPVNDMKRELDYRARANDRIANADAEREKRMAAAQAAYDKAKANADMHYKWDTEDSEKQRDYAQANIDKLLKR